MAIFKKEVLNMFSKDRFVIELDDRYFNQKDLINAACKYLNNQGKKAK